MDIKSVIKAHGYTIERIANEWESKNGKSITRGALSQSINNNPTIDTLQKIANVIGCKVGDFLLMNWIMQYVVLTAVLSWS